MSDKHQYVASQLLASLKRVLPYIKDPTAFMHADEAIKRFSEVTTLDMQEKTCEWHQPDDFDMPFSGAGRIGTPGARCDFCDGSGTDPSSKSKAIGTVKP